MDDRRGGSPAGAGLWSLLTGGSAAGLLKVAVIVCSATAVTAGVCAGVIAVVNDVGKPTRAPVAEAKQQPEPSAVPTAQATPAQPRRPQPIATATPTPRPRRPQRSDRAAADTTGEKQIPASAPAEASEFNPSASSAIEPAPAAEAGGGEFSP